MPLEFSVAAFRFGHKHDPRTCTTTIATSAATRSSPETRRSASCSRSRATAASSASPRFPSTGWSSGNAGSTSDTTLPNRLARRIDTQISDPLAALPGPTPTSLARRNLRRGYNLAIPTGQAVRTARRPGAQRRAAQEWQGRQAARDVPEDDAAAGRHPQGGRGEGPVVTRSGRSVAASSPRRSSARCARTRSATSTAGGRPRTASSWRMVARSRRSRTSCGSRECWPDPADPRRDCDLIRG